MPARMPVSCPTICVSPLRAPARGSVSVVGRFGCVAVRPRRSSLSREAGLPRGRGVRLTMELLSIWLCFVGLSCLNAIRLSFFLPSSLRDAVFSGMKVMQEVHARTFGAWTILSCFLCFSTAFHLDNEELYLSTFLSFVICLGYFLVECFVYHTIAVKTLRGMILIAGGSIVWMGLEWKTHHGRAIQ